jgi:hypothetical protein
MGGPDEPSTEELRIGQAAREERERDAAERAEDDQEAAQHDRRAEKSAYLRSKLEDRERAERESD